MERKRKLVIGAAAVLAAAGGGAAIAASGSSPSEENQAIIDDAAKQLGVSSSKLSDALKQALVHRVDAAVVAGRLTKAEGDALKARINSGDAPFFGGVRDRGFGHFGRLDAAAAYLGLTETQLHAELESGKSLAQVARAHDKSVQGLVDALVADAKARLDDAVAAGRLTRAEANETLDGLRGRIGNLVNATGLGGGPRFGPPHSGFRHFWRPPA